MEFNNNDDDGGDGDDDNGNDTDNGNDNDKDNDSDSNNDNETIDENNSRCLNELWKRMSKVEVGLNDQERKRINIALSRHFPDMSVKQIRKIRNKPGYKSLLSNAFQDCAALRHPENSESSGLPAFDGHEGIDKNIVSLDSRVKLKQFVIERYDSTGKRRALLIS